MHKFKMGTAIAFAAALLALPALADDMSASSMMAGDAMSTEAMSTEAMGTDAMGASSAMAGEAMGSDAMSSDAMGGDGMAMSTASAGEVVAIMPNGQMGTMVMDAGKMNMTIGMATPLAGCVMFITGADGKTYQVDTSSAAAMTECESIAK